MKIITATIPINENNWVFALSRHTFFATHANGNAKIAIKRQTYITISVVGLIAILISSNLYKYWT